MQHLNLNAPDIFWVGFAASWIVVSLIVIQKYWSYRQAAWLIERKALRQIGLSIAWDFLRAEFFRLSSHLTSMAIGVAVIFTLPDSDRPPTRLGTFVSGGLILMNLFSGINSINAFISFNRRSQLMAQLGEEHIREIIDQVAREKGVENVHSGE